MKTDIKSQMNAEQPEAVLSDLEAKHGLAPARCYAALLEQLKDLYLASSLLRIRIQSHGFPITQFEDYRRHTESMKKTEAVLHQMQHNIVLDLNMAKPK